MRFIMPIKKISESNLATCHEYHNYINDYLYNHPYLNDYLYNHPYLNDYRKDKFETDNPSTYSDLLNEWIDDIFNYNTEHIHSFIKEMVQSIKNTKGDFSWLEEERIAYFTFLKLLEGVKYGRARDDVAPRLTLDRNCSSMRSRINTIKEYFSNWDIDEQIKFIVIENIQHSWTKVDQLKDPFKELKQTRNHELIKWTWCYSLKKIKNDRYAYNPVNRTILPTTIDEKYNAIFAIHDFHFASDKNLHKVFCMEYRRALNSKKFREKEETKTINTQLKIKVKERLDKIQEHYQYSQQKILEMLINEHYKSIENKLDTNNFT